jgi:hypothetical protein
MADTSLARTEADDLLDSAFDDILSGVDASRKLDRVAHARKNVVPLHTGPFRQQTRTVRRSAIDEAFDEIIEEELGGKQRKPAPPERRRDTASAAEIDAALDAALRPAPASPRSDDERQRTAAKRHAEHDLVASAEQRALAVATSRDAERRAAEAVGGFMSFVDTVSREFPGVSTDADLLWLMDSDPIAATRFLGRQAIGQRLAAVANQQLFEANEIRQVAFNINAEYEDQRFGENNPGWSDTDAIRVRDTLEEVYGVSGPELQHLYCTAVPLNLADPRALRLMGDAASELKGQRLERESELWPAILDLFEHVGFSPEEVRALTSGGPCLMRDHRVQEIVRHAVDWHHPGNARRYA